MCSFLKKKKTLRMTDQLICLFIEIETIEGLKNLERALITGTIVQVINEQMNLFHFLHLLTHRNCLLRSLLLASPTYSRNVGSLE